MCKGIRSDVVRMLGQTELIDFQDAVDALNTLQTPFAVIEARRKAGVRPDEASVREMRAYLARIGYTVRIHLYIPRSQTAS